MLCISKFLSDPLTGRVPLFSCCSALTKEPYNKTGKKGSLRNVDEGLEGFGRKLYNDDISTAGEYEY